MATRTTEEDATIPEQIQAEIQRLQPIADKLEFAQSEARDITKAIKYEQTTRRYFSPN